MSDSNLTDAIQDLKDPKALGILGDLTNALARESDVDVEKELTAQLQAVLAHHFSVSTGAEPLPNGDLARLALRAMAEDPELAKRIRVEIDAPGSRDLGIVSGVLLASAVLGGVIQSV